MIRSLLRDYELGNLGDTTMPEDTHPTLDSTEEKLLYYTLPMSLNYQRDSFKLWESARSTWQDPSTKRVFDLQQVSKMRVSDLQQDLLKYKLALQPNKHIDTWLRISVSIYENWGSISELLVVANHDYLELRNILQVRYKQYFPYLSGPKIFNYWSYIIQEYCGLQLHNRDQIEIAPDTHVIQASVKLGVITMEEMSTLKREEISLRWRELLKGTGIDPIDVHSPLWFWSRGKFAVEI